MNLYRRTVISNPSHEVRFTEITTVVVPWCTEHDLPMVKNTDWCVQHYGDPDPIIDCRLEEPARHYVIGVDDV